MKDIKWGRVVVWIIVGTVIMVGSLFLYVTIRMVARGFQGMSTDAEAQKAVMSGIVPVVVMFLAALVAGFFGGRGPARHAEGSYLLNGVLSGVGMAILNQIYSFVSSGTFSPWALAAGGVAIGGSLLGGWVGGRGAEAEAYD